MARTADDGCRLCVSRLPISPLNATLRGTGFQVRIARARTHVTPDRSMRDFLHRCRP